MNKSSMIMLMLCVSLLAGCQSKPARTESNPLQTESASTKQADIPYKVADGYFQSNQVKRLPSASITTQAEFERLFGAAAVMGENGMPTPIDFTKEYVIAVSKPVTDYSTTLAPVSLKRDELGNIVFTYRVTKGEKQSYSIVPCLLVVVENSYEGNVLLNELE